MTDKLYKPAVNAAAIIGAFYEAIDRVEAAGGANSISGVAACNTFLTQQRANRKRVDELVMKPLLEEIERKTAP